MANSKTRIVVVDDNEIVLQKARESLEAAGYHVITRSRAIGCVALTLQEEPALLLLDVGMPGVGGDTLVRLLMTAAPQRQTVVLLYSGLSEQQLKRLARESGADGYVCKSSDFDLLVKEVEQWVGAPSKLPPAKNHSPNSEPASGVEDRNPHILFIDDDIHMLSAYRRLIQSQQMNVEFALSGSQGLRWILSKDPPDVVVCDLMMAPPSGVEVYSQALAKDARWRDKFVIVTGMSDARQRLGPDYTGPILGKPIDNDQLLRAIRECLFTRSHAVQLDAT